MSINEDNCMHCGKPVDLLSAVDVYHISRNDRRFVGTVCLACQKKDTTFLVPPEKECDLS